MLDFNDLQRKNVERCIKGFNHKLEDWSLMEWCGATAFEAGEAGNKAKKLKRIEQNIKGNKSGENQRNLTDAVAHEIGDTIVYAFLTLSAAGYNAEEVVRNVFNSKSDEIGSDIKI